MTSREKKLLKIARYWKARSLNEMLRHGCVRMCHEHHSPVNYDPFRKPVERTAKRDEIVARQVPRGA